MHRVYSVVVFVVLASLDNVAIGLVPPLYGPISGALGVPQRLLGLVTAVSFLVSAVAAVAWAYVGDRTNRKPLLMVGTLIWAAGTGGSALAQSYPTFLAAQLVAAVGLGAVGSVGFSVVTDLISPRRRGLVMSFWGLSQGVGTLAGTLTGGILGATDWRRPFLLLTGVGLAATVAYLVTYDVRRGQSEPELAEALDAGADYDYRITRADLPRILARRTNRWLALQGLTAQAAFGSLVWLPVLFAQRAEAQGYSAATAVVVGSVFATLFQLGGVLSIVGGLVGDALQRRTPSGRALVAAVGILAAVPFYLVLFFVPIRIDVPDGGSLRRGGRRRAGQRGHRAHRRAEPARRGVGAGPHLRKLAELVRADRRRQPARAPGHRLQPRQPGQRGRSGGRQRAGRGGLRRAAGGLPAAA